MNKECYQELKERMEEIRDIGDLRYLYTAKRNDEGTLVYVVGGLPEDADDFRYPGDAGACVLVYKRAERIGPAAGGDQQGGDIPGA